MSLFQSVWRLGGRPTTYKHRMDWCEILCDWTCHFWFIRVIAQQLLDGLSWKKEEVPQTMTPTDFCDPLLVPETQPAHQNVCSSSKISVFTRLNIVQSFVVPWDHQQVVRWFRVKFGGNICGLYEIWCLALYFSYGRPRQRLYTSSLVLVSPPASTLDAALWCRCIKR